jgi:cytoskeletal protein CcmA (bactofilin family)
MAAGVAMLGTASRGPLRAGLLAGLLVAAGPFAGAALAADTRAGSSLEIVDPVGEDLYGAAATVLVTTAVDGDAVLAGGTVTVAGDIAGDALLAGGSVDVAGVIGDDLRAAGGQVVISGLVTDQAIVAGGNVALAPEGAIAGRMWIAGNDVEVAGQVGGDLQVTAASVRIGGRIEGDVDIRARRIEIEPGAIIAGDLTWRSDAEPVIAEDAQILGNVGGARPAFDDEGGLRLGRGIGGRLALALAVFLATAVLWRLFPEFVRRGSGTLRAAPVRTLVAGGVAFMLTPLAVLVLLLTAIGWLLALVLVAGYAFALAGTGLLALAALAEAFASRGVPGAGWSRRLLLLALLSAGVVLLQGVPGIGGLVTILLWLCGLGMTVRVLREPAPGDRGVLPAVPG